MSDGDAFTHILYGTSTLATSGGFESRRCDIVGVAEHKRGGEFLQLLG